MHVRSAVGWKILVLNGLWSQGFVITTKMSASGCWGKVLSLRWKVKTRLRSNNLIASLKGCKIPINPTLFEPFRIWTYHKTIRCNKVKKYTPTNTQVDIFIYLFFCIKKSRDFKLWIPSLRSTVSLK